MSSLLQINPKQANIQLPCNMISAKEKAQILVKEKYEKQYKDETDKHNLAMLVSIFAAYNIINLIWGKADKLQHAICGIGAIILLKFLPLVPPKKEKYDAAMQKELDEIA